MQYTCDIIIDKPIEDVIKLFDNPENLTKWMPGLQEFNLLSGDPGHPGAKSELKFLHKGQSVELVETIVERDLPRVFSATYESGMGFNQVSASFEEIAANQTKYTTDNYFEMKGIMMKLMALLMPGTFKKQSMVYLNAFKTFAENQ